MSGKELEAIESGERLGTLRSDDGDDIVNVKKAVVLISITTTLHVHYAFLYISLPLLHDCDVKVPNFAFYGGRKQTTTRVFFLLNLGMVLRYSTPGEFAYIVRVSELE